MRLVLVLAQERGLDGSMRPSGCGDPNVAAAVPGGASGDMDQVAAELSVGVMVLTLWMLVNGVQVVRLLGQAVVHVSAPRGRRCC